MNALTEMTNITNLLTQWQIKELSMGLLGGSKKGYFFKQILAVT